MRAAKFKTAKNNNQIKIVFSILLSVILTHIICGYFVVFAATTMESYLISRVKKENKLLLKDAFSYLVREDVSIDSLLKVNKNSKDEIVDVAFDIKGATKILSLITGYINSNLESENFFGYRLDVPIGIVSGNPILMNLGPRFPIKVEIEDVAVGNVRTKIREFGINNALLEIYIEVSIDFQTIYPFATIEDKSSYEALIASSVIEGAVPDIFSGAINSKSEAINLPLNQ